MPFRTTGRPGWIDTPGEHETRQRPGEIGRRCKLRPKLRPRRGIADKQRDGVEAFCDLRRVGQRRGKTLRQLLSDEQYLPPEVAAAIGIELAIALDHAHGLGLIVEADDP